MTCNEPAMYLKILNAKIVCGLDVPAKPQKFDFLYTNFSPNYPPISIPFSIEKHPILPKLGAFYNNLFKIHPIFEFGLLHRWWKPTDRYTKFCENAH